MCFSTATLKMKAIPVTIDAGAGKAHPKGFPFTLSATTVQQVKAQIHEKGG